MRTFYWWFYHVLSPAAWASLLLWFVLQEWYDCNWNEPNTAIRTFETAVFALGFAWTTAGAWLSLRRMK